VAAEGVDDSHRAIHQEFRQLAMAFGQLVHGGTDAQLETARKELGDTRRALYRILGDEDPS
jgi:hypothetical protein